MKMILSEYGNYLENVTNELRKNAHDFNAHLNAITALAEDDSIVDSNVRIIEYISAIVSDNKMQNSTSLISDNQLVSAYLAYIIKMAENADIGLKYNIEAPTPSYNIPYYDFVLILNNLLNNAIEEVAKSNISDRVVNISFEEDRIIISNPLSNRFDVKTVDQFKNKGFSSKGSDRGFGVTTAFEIAKRNSIQTQIFIDGNKIYFELVFNTETY
jgi:two-component system sensor histidine kinase AgrC